MKKMVRLLQLIAYELNELVECMARQFVAKLKRMWFTSTCRTGLEIKCVTCFH